MQKVLVIDDERDMRLLLSRYLQKHNFEVLEAASGATALEILKKIEPDVILCDFKLGDITGSALLSKIKESYRHIPVIIITGYGDIKIAVEVMKLGAYDYVTKPLFPDEILLTIQKALRQQSQSSISSASAVQKKEKPSTDSIGPGQYIFGDSPHFNTLLQQIDRVGPTNYSVIIYGETGSGKEAIAQEIHKKSNRKSKPFVAIDCGALSKELAGSELFGHEKGAFTGALFQKTGSFELANGGTIFLDEIANLPYDVQVSLLRVVQERKMRRVGGTKDIDLDVRIIVASNELLWSKTKNANTKSKFREDLYHRFNEFSITVPPLRERKEDIIIFSNYFLKLTNLELSKSIKGFTPEVLSIFSTYIWPGNLRELKNVIKRSTLLSDGELIEAKTLPFEISNYSKLQFENRGDAYVQNDFEPTNIHHSEEADDEPPTPILNIAPNGLKAAGIDAEYELIVKVLKQVKFNKSKAAKLLNIDRKTLYNKLEQYQLHNKKV